MRTLWLALLAGALGCKAGGVSQTDELCAKAAAIYAQCEARGDATAQQWELEIDRWRGLCRATFTGETKQLLPDALALWTEMTDDVRGALREQARCTAAATDCAAYKACEEK